MGEKKSKVYSPCVSVCQYDQNNTCFGCMRSKEERVKWKDTNTTDEWKLENLNNIQERMPEYTLKSWKEAYKKKVKRLNKNEST